MKTLLVEDDPLSLLLLSEQIKTRGYAITACENPVNALNLYQQTFYPLIITDLNLPGMDGLELCRHIRALPQGRHTMILVVTGRDSPEDLQAVLDAGADDYLTKPVSQEMLNIRLTIIEQRIYHLEQRKKAEQERENLIALIENSADFIVMASLAGQVRYLNKAGQELVGLADSEEAKAFRIFDYAPEAERPQIEQAVAAVMRDGVWRGESYFRHFQTRAEIPVEINFFHIHQQETAQPLALAAVIRDMTPRKLAETRQRQLEAQLHQSQRLEALGILAGGIAHDFNNILGTMLGYTELLLTEYPENRKIQDYLQQVYRAGERAADLVQQILTFSRAEEHRLQPTLIAPIIADALKMLRATLPANVVIRQDLQPNRHPILADATQIHQVLVNLGTNAAYALRGRGGLLDVALAEERHDPAQAQILGLAAGAYLKLTVRDTGCGMPPDVREHIFEPFFTTKDVGEGSGLGLSVVHGIVKGHQGVITVESAPGQGTAFRIFFPLPAGLALPQEPGETPALTHGQEHILIVEDEAALARLYEIALTKLGYRVTVCTNSAEALQMFQADAGRFDLVFTDQAMPNLTGAQLSQELLRLRPDLPIILATGYSDTMSEQDALALGVRQYLKKPVKFGVLTQTIRKIFAAKT